MDFILKKDYAKRSLPILIIIIIFFSMQQVINYLSYDYAGPSGLVVNAFTKLGLEEEFTRMILWYALQVAMTLILIKILVKKPIRETGFNLNNFKASLKYVIIFSIAYPVLFFTIWITLKSNGLNTLTPVLANKGPLYIIKDFLSYGLLPGLGEEPFFRVFIIQFLAVTTFKGFDLYDRKIRIYLILLSSVFFSMGHIFISLSPFYFKFNIVQLIQAFALGVFYASVYLKTKSIAAPIVCHNFSDFVYRLATFILV